MKYTQNRTHLRTISLKYDCVLMDTSTITSLTRKDPRYFKNLEDRINYFHDNIGSLRQMEQQVSSGSNLYIVSGVYKELLGVKPYSIKKRAKKAKGYEDRKHLEYQRLIRKSSKETRKLANLFRDSNRELNFKINGNSSYEIDSEKYLFLKSNFELSEVDYELLITGLNIYNQGSSIIILSNDRFICDSWDALLLKEKILKRRFNFFQRSGLDNFRPGSPHRFSGKDYWDKLSVNDNVNNTE